MFITLFAAAVAAQSVRDDSGYVELAAVKDESAITVINGKTTTEDPAKLINLGVAYARIGDSARARAMFRAANTSSERVELETMSGDWIYSRVLARRGLAMLDRGKIHQIEALALK